MRRTEPAPGAATTRPAADPDLHGSAPDVCALAILLVDVINDLEFPGGDRLLRQFLPAAKQIVALRQWARLFRVPVIYVNDNFGLWRSDFHELVKHCLEDGVRGRKIAEMLQPEESDYFVLKPKHSGFFCTPLELLLEHLEAHTLVITGVAANICVLDTATDAAMRDFKVIVPADCVAAINAAQTGYALRHVRNVLRGDVRPLELLPLEQLLDGHRKRKSIAGARNRRPSVRIARPSYTRA